ncbi:MAG: F0F1 ATP synthase subunit I [Gammaproteobacteria bacterium]|nr:F0F1 ATP synthase subunit I [Gammaproteobacteria bacterium]
MTNLKPPSIYRVIVAQLAWTVLLSIAGLMAFEVVFGYSALLGGLISALPNSYFALHAFKYQGAQNADKVVKGFIRGELGKIVFTGMLFALSFTLVTSLNEFALIIGFITTHFVGVVMSGFISYSPTRKNTQI